MGDGLSVNVQVSQAKESRLYSAAVRNQQWFKCWRATRSDVQFTRSTLGLCFHCSWMGRRGQFYHWRAGKTVKQTHTHLPPFLPYSPWGTILRGGKKILACYFPFFPKNQKKKNLHRVKIQMDGSSLIHSKCQSHTLYGRRDKPLQREGGVQRCVRGNLHIAIRFQHLWLIVVCMRLIKWI